MTINDIVWRQTQKIKERADTLIVMSKSSDSPSIRTIKINSSMLIYSASMLTEELDKAACCDVYSYMTNLQTSLWTFMKNCTDIDVYQYAHKLYNSCAIFRKRFKERMQNFNIDITNPPHTTS